MFQTIGEFLMKKGETGLISSGSGGYCQKKYWLNIRPNRQDGRAAPFPFPVRHIRGDSGSSHNTRGKEFP